MALCRPPAFCSYRQAQRKTYVKPRQRAPRPPKNPLILPTRTLLQPVQRPNPVLRPLPLPEEHLLIMQPRTQIIAHQRKEARNRECFPAVPQNVKVDGFGVEVVAEEGDGGVDGDHE